MSNSRHQPLWIRLIALCVAFAMGFPTNAQALAGGKDTKQTKGASQALATRASSVPESTAKRELVEQTRRSAGLASKTPTSLELVQGHRALSGDLYALWDGQELGIRSDTGDTIAFVAHFDDEVSLQEISAKGEGRLRIQPLSEPGSRSEVEYQGSDLGSKFVRDRFASPVVARAVRIEWTPTSGPGSILSELALWVSDEPALRSNYASTPQLQLASGQMANAEVLPAKPSDTCRFDWELPPSLPTYAQAYLRYRLSDRAHWSQIEHRINGLASASASEAQRTTLPGVQVERISPASLRVGANHIAFGDPQDPSTTCPVDKVELVLLSHSRVYELPNGSNEMPRSLAFSGEVQPHRINFYVQEAGGGELHMFERRGEGGARVVIPMQGYGKGWHSVELDAQLGPLTQLAVALQPNASRAPRPGKVGRARLGRLLLSASSVASSTSKIWMAPARAGADGGVGLRGLVLGQNPPDELRVEGHRVAVAPDGSFALSLPAKALKGKGDLEVRWKGGQERVKRDQDPCLAQSSNLTPDWGAPYAKCISAQEGGVIEFGGLRLQIPKHALAQDTRISVRPLSPRDLAPMQGGKVNVTTGQGGFRLGPPGLVFQKPAVLTLPYDNQRIPKDARKSDIFGFYYDTQKSQWERIARVEVDRGELASATHHFTDFVAATISLPDAAGPKSFDPNAIKGIELANPTSKIPLIAAPQGNSYGSVNLGHPIDLPPGRNGVQPSLGFSYSSSAGNDWLGMGWNLGVSTIEIDTRFGVPRYQEGESLTYLIDGEEIVEAPEAYFDERPALKSPRTDARQYIQRVQGRFDRIERIGVQAPYRWEVTDKSGTRYLYGESGQGRLSDPGESEDPEQRTRVFRWYLERIIDTFGNEVRYHYTRDEGCLASAVNPGECREKFTKIYPESITYTHHPSALDGYRVRFELGRAQRSDTILNGRPGFVEQTRRRLAGVRVEYRTAQTPDYQLIRRYALRYERGDFGKSLLSSISLQGPRDVPVEPEIRLDETLDPPHFVQHRFTYQKNEQRDDEGKAFYAVFADTQQVGDPNATQAQPQVWGQGPNAQWGLTRTRSKSKGISGSAGFGFGPFRISGGAGVDSGSDTVHQMLVDLGGDGLPDFVQDSGRGWQNQLQRPPFQIQDFFRQRDLDAQRQGSFRPYAVPGATGPLATTSRSGKSVNGGISLGFFGASASASRSTTKDTSTLSDMDGDGLVDRVRVSGSQVYVRRGTGRGGFSDQEIEWGALSVDDIHFTQSELIEQAKEEGFRIDPLVRWRAPHRGRVVVAGSLSKRLSGGDGVFTGIYRGSIGGRELIWGRAWAPDDLSACVPQGSSDCGGGIELDLEAGDELFFRVSASADPEDRSPADSANDQVDWRPTVRYLGEEPALEPYGRPVHRFSFEEDYRVSGLPAPGWITPVPGTVAIGGTFSKLETADDLEIQVVHRSGDGTVIDVHEQVIAAEAAGDISLAFPSIDLGGGEQLTFEVHSDANVDPLRVNWEPSICYLKMGRYDPQSQSFVVGEVRCDAQGQCRVDGDPSADEVIEPDVVEQQGQSTVATRAFLGGEARQSVDGAGVSQVDLEIQFEGFSPTQLEDCALMVQGVHKLYAKVKPDASGRAVISTALSVQGPVFVTAIAPSTPGGRIQVDSASLPVNERRLDPAYHDLATSVREDPFSGGFHGWSFGDFNGAYDFETEPLRFPNVDPLEDNAPYFFGIPAPLENSEDQRVGHAWRMRAGAFVVPSVWQPAHAAASDVELGEGGNSAGGGGLGVIRMSDTWNADYGASAFIASGGFNKGSTTTELDLIDINGDRRPDSITAGGVRFNGGPTEGFGARVSMSTGLSGAQELREVDHFTGRLGLSFSKKFQLKNLTNTRGKTKDFITTKVNAGQTYGMSNTKSDLIDINGDGLVDQVFRKGGADFWVRFGLGYRFSDPVVWKTGFWSSFDLQAGQSVTGIIDDLLNVNRNGAPHNVRVGDTGSTTVGGGFDFIVSVGAGKTWTMSRTVVDLQDMNGDALPDAVMKLPQEDFIRVKLNLGDGFGSEQLWPVPQWPAGLLSTKGYEALGSGDVLSFERNQSKSFNAGGSFCFGICLGASGYKSNGKGSSTLRMQDIDGDGLVDHVLKAQGDQRVHAKLNQLGRSNLLLEVERPLGGKFEVDYRRVGNEVDLDAQVDMPQSQYTMAAVRIEDGRGNTYADVYEYAKGRYDRKERVNYGFAQLKMTRVADRSSVESNFLTTDFFRKGMLAKTTQREWVWGLERDMVQEQYTYASPPETTGRLDYFFPHPIESTVTRWEKADPNSKLATLSGGQISVTQRQAFDAYGDVKKSVIEGNAHTADDDLEYEIDYQRSTAPYFSKPNKIVARGRQSTTPLRERSAVYDARGSLMSVGSVVYGGERPDGGIYRGETARTHLAYDEFGHLQQVRDPSGFEVRFSYDDVLKTYRSEATDSFGYSDLSIPDYRFGVTSAAVDVNHNVMISEYDDYGRLSRVFDPRALAAGEPTIEMVYSLNGSPRGPPSFPAWAKTLHRDEQKDEAGQSRDPIVTVTLVDGMSRVIQTKKDVEKDFVDGNAPVVGMVVSGQIRFDNRGRVNQAGQPTFVQLQRPSHLPGSDATKMVEAEPLRPTLTEFDGLGRITKITTPNQAVTQTAYSIAKSPGRSHYVQRFTDAKEREHLVYSDARDDIVLVHRQNEIGGVLKDLRTRYFYNPVGELTSVIDTRGNQTQATYDSRGTMVALESPDAGLMTWVYDLAGRTVSKQSARLRDLGQSIRYHYDYHRLQRIEYPDAPDVRYEYGTPAETGAYFGNVAGRIKREESEIGTRTFRYDALGNVSRDAITFAAIGIRPDAVREYALNYDFDSFGRLLEIEFPNRCREVVSYDYDAAGKVRSVQGRTTNKERRCEREVDIEYLKHLGYDEFGSRVRMAYGNRTEMRFRYDEDTRRLVELDADRETFDDWSKTYTTLPFQRLRYEYDLVGNLVAQRNEMPAELDTDPEYRVKRQSYRYDRLDQLVQSEGFYEKPGDWTRRYEFSKDFDELGNIVKKEQSSWQKHWGDGPEQLDLKQSYCSNYSYDGAQPHAPSTIEIEAPRQPRITSRKISYDASGNQKLWNEYRDYREVEWTAEDKVRRVRDNAVVRSESYYDGGGSRRLHVQQVGNVPEALGYIGQNATIRDGEYLTHHVFVGTSRIASRRDGSVLNDGHTLWFHGDYLGSTHYLSDKNSALVSHSEYFPSGELWVDEHIHRSLDSRTSFLFNGKEFDRATGLYAFEARSYDPRVGQWLSPDPAMVDYFLTGVAGGVWNPKNLNGYGYAWGNPVTLQDPDGQFLHILGGAAIGAAVSLAVEGASQAWNGEFDGTKLAVAAGSGAVTGAVGAATGGMGLVAKAVTEVGTEVVVGTAGRVIEGEEVTVSGAVMDAAGAIVPMPGSLGRKVDDGAPAPRVDASGAASKGDASPSPRVGGEGEGPDELYMAGKPFERRLEHGLNRQLHIDDISSHYGINLRGTKAVYDPSLEPGKLGVTRKNEGGGVIRIGPDAFVDDATLANTIAHELSHARDYIRGGSHKPHGNSQSRADGTAYGAGNALEAWIRGNM